MRLGTFTAHVVVDGKPLEEYDVTLESPTKAICWIPSEEGKSFLVQWKCHEETRVAASEGVMWTDGIACGRVVMLSGSLGVNDTGTFAHFVNATTTRDLMFAPIQLSDDDSLLDKVIPKDLGEIVLKFRCGVAERRKRPSERDDVLKDNVTLHERSKKALAVHCVGFGQERPRNFGSFYYHFTPNSEPEITFVFKYQPLGILQANGVAPKPAPMDAGPSVENPTGEHDVGAPRGVASEDIKPAKLNNRIRDLENELKRLRGLQDADSGDREPKRVKREELKEGRRPLFAPGEVIDLT